jgi:PAS domain S-box-containing protein
MVVMDAETRRMLAVNDAAVREYGWSREDILSMPVNDFYPPEDLPALEAMRLANAGDEYVVVRGLRHRKKDGTIFDVEMHTHAFELDAKPAILTIMENVTVRHSVEAQLRQAQKMEAVGQLTGGIAHDFNNILFVILANTEALEEEESLDAPVVARIAEIAKAVGRASSLTRQLLAFSRRQTLNPQQTDLNDLVSDTGKLLRRALGAGIEIQSILTEGLCITNIDRSQLETALVNLCINARDAMPDGGSLLIETRNVTLDEEYVALNPAAVAGNYALVSVTDTGSGMGPDTLSKVFEPFFTTKEVGKGTGLGLSMVYGFIKQSKGHIKIYSEVGAGTSIKLYLPCSGQAAEKALNPKDVSLPRGTERILVVEDESQVRASVVLQLQSLGYAASAVSGARAGIVAFETATVPYKLLLTDIVMPGPMNGKALADEVARRWPSTKVVFMSGFAETALTCHGRLDEDVTLLSKPFRKAELAQTIRRVIDAKDGSDHVRPEAA